jgi:NAD(P)-dependent dehydrogenase (short-subunit alcohol dehydrogenase family)
MRPYDRDTTTDEVLQGVDLSGKRIVITGTSSGLGRESARALASKGASITMLARNASKNEAAADTIRAQVPGADLETRAVDLTSLESVRTLAKDFLSDHSRIDVLINNAGVMVCPFGTTSDGFEMQLGTNHLGHFLLTVLLAPALVGGEPSRVVELSSGAHGMAGVDFDDLMFERREYDPWIAYAQSKTANALFAMELDRRLADRGVKAFSVHPGMIMTELARHMTAEVMEQMQVHIRARAEEAGASGEEAAGAGMRFKSLEAGAATQVWAATAPELDAHGGAYLADCQVGEVGGNIADSGVAPHARDPEAATRLWSVSEELVGEQLGG